MHSASMNLKAQAQGFLSAKYPATKTFLSRNLRSYNSRRATPSYRCSENFHQAATLVSSVTL